MATIHKGILDARVAARNRVHQLAKDNLPSIIAALTPFIGKHVQLFSGRFSAKVMAALPQSVFDPAIDYDAGSWIYQCHYGFGVTFRLGEQYDFQERPGRSCTTYAEAAFVIGEINGLTLTKTCEPYDIRSDYTAEEVFRLRNEHKASVLAMQAAQNKLFHFGTFDMH